ncbi:MAG: hypothetical protein IKP46_06550 [Bacteroidales bacterium]|nr:hypothetical protein [Bacteroidales bacterium]
MRPILSMMPKKRLKMNEFLEPLGDLSQTAKEYVDLRVDEVKLKTAKGLSVSVSRILSYMVLLLVAANLLLVLSFAAVLFLGDALKSYGLAALIVSAALALLLAVLFLLRNKLFRGGFVKLFVKLFFPMQDENQV